MTNDGRTFFTTEDALVHADTNDAQDVYEYVDGRPQLITAGHRRDPRSGRRHLLGCSNPPGLVGVSADGTDVYFSTYDTLVRQDHNGLFLKFYDARAGGGFPAPRAAAALRRGRRVPRRRQPAAGADPGRHRRQRSAGGNACSGRPAHSRKKKKRPARHRRKHQARGHASQQRGARR